MSQKVSQDAKSIGARFRSARALAPDLNRKSFCERYGINRYTMQSWENGLHVSKGKNVEKFIEALAREGVYCTAEWLIEGIGEPAKPLNLVNQNHEPAGLGPTKNSTIVEQLVKAHREFDETMVSFKVPDDAMAPQFLAGDLVIGRLLAQDEEKIAHQKYCIVELNPGSLVLRKVICLKDEFMLLASDNRLQSFTLSFGNPIYLVVWHKIYG